MSLSTQRKVFFVTLCLCVMSVFCSFTKPQATLASLLEMYPTHEEEEVIHYCYDTSGGTRIIKCDYDAHYAATMLAKLCYIEYRGYSDTQVSMVCWCALNRVDINGQTLEQVLTTPSQFGYKASTHVDPRLYRIARDVYLIWRDGGEGRTLPPEYTQFRGDGTVNHFYPTWEDAENHTNEYTGWLGSPYDT